MHNSFLFKLIPSLKSFKLNNCDVLKKRSYDLFDEIRVLKDERDLYLKKYSTLSKVLQKKTGEIFSLEVTKKGNQEVIISYSETMHYDEAYIKIMVWPILEYNTNSKPELKLEAKFSNNLKTINIEDITVAPINTDKGLGSHAMQKLIEIAQSKNYKEIIGELEYGDLDNHRERLMHFYEKYGFKIRMNSDNMYGRIKLDIN